jgi:hypothetical protein
LRLVVSKCTVFECDIHGSSPDPSVGRGRYSAARQHRSSSSHVSPVARCRDVRDRRAWCSALSREPARGRVRIALATPSRNKATPKSMSQKPN